MSSMDKRKLHHIWTYTRYIHPAYFLVLTLLSGAICIMALRANNQHMIELRDAVYAADEKNTDVRQPLQALQAYVTTHMNTNLSTGNTTVYPPIQLKNTYDRLVKTESDQIASANGQLYNEAQHYCEGQNSTDISGRNRVPCIEQYVLAHTSQKVQPIPDALYKFAFVTPRWSPDLAGWSMLATILFAIATVISFIANRWLRRKSR